MTFIQIGPRPYPRLFDPVGVFLYEANALKGRYNLTQGLAPVTRVRNKKSPCKGLITFGVLIPRIPFVQLHVIQLAYFAQLVLERHLLVVLLLTFDVCHHRIHVAVAHAKRPIPILPCEMPERIAGLFVDPSGRARLDGTHDFRQIHLLAQQKQNVHMVRGAANLDGRTPVIIEYLRHVRMYLLQVRLGDRVRATLGGEHQMDVYFR